jgi:hypothetical protein
VPYADRPVNVRLEKRIAGVNLPYWGDSQLITKGDIP